MRGTSTTAATPAARPFHVPSEGGLRVIICSRQSVRPRQELTLDYHQASVMVRAQQQGCLVGSQTAHAD